MIEYAPAILGFIVLLGGTLWGIWKYNKRKIEKKVDTENRIDEAFYKIKELDKKLDQEQEDADRHHKNLYDKIDKVQVDVAFIRGKIVKL